MHIIYDNHYNNIYYTNYNQYVSLLLIIMIIMIIINVNDILERTKFIRLIYANQCHAAHSDEKQF